MPACQTRPIGQNLAIHFNASLLQAVHEAAVCQSALTGSCVDTRNPEVDGTGVFSGDGHGKRIAAGCAILPCCRWRAGRCCSSGRWGLRAWCRPANLYLDYLNPPITRITITGEYWHYCCKNVDAEDFGKTELHSEILLKPNIIKRDSIKVLTDRK